VSSDTDTFDIADAWDDEWLGIDQWLIDEVIDYMIDDMEAGGYI
jgi:hypothetical protein